MRAVITIPQLGLGLCAGLAILALRATAQDPPQDGGGDQTLEERVEELEKRAAADAVRIDVLTAELADVSALVDQTVRYLNEQARSAEKMAATLDTSEQEGFTYGINPRSREVLLAGWRDRLKSIGTEVPGAPEEEPEETVTPPVRR
jgi:uncharacterized coiled-coil protein SlyX